MSSNATESEDMGGRVSPLSLFFKIVFAFFAVVLLAALSGYFGGTLVPVEQQFKSSISAIGSPIGTIIRKKPEFFPEFLDAYRMERQGEGERAELRRAEILQSLIGMHFKQAEDKAVIAYAALYLEYLEAVNAGDHMDCFYAVFSQKGKAEYSIIAVLQKNGLLPKLNDIQAELISSALSKPQMIPDSKRAQPLVSQIASSIDVEYQRFFVRLNSKGLRREDQEEGCSAQIAFYKNILALPPKEASLVLRFLLF